MNSTGRAPDPVNKSDLLLIEQFRAGSQKAAAALLARYASLVHHAAARVDVPGADDDDLRQEGYMGLLNAVRTYDASRGALFRTYAASCVNNALKNVRAASYTKKSRVLLNALPLEEVRDTPTEESENPEGRVIGQESAKEVEALIDKTLSPYEKEVFFLYLNGCGYDRTAKKLGSTPKSVDNALQRARKKLKSVLNDTLD